MLKKKNKKTKSGGLNKKALINSIMTVFHQHPAKVYNYKQLAAQLMVKDSAERKLINEILNELVMSDELKETGRGKFKLKSKPGYITGRIDITKAGYGFVVTEEFSEDIFVAHRHLNHAMDGDLVKVYLFAHRKKRNYEGEVVEILERARTTFVGIMEVSERYAFLVPEQTLPFDLFIPFEYLNNARNGQKAVGRITDWPKQAKNPIGEIVEVLGDVGDNDTEMHAILAEFELPYRFEEEIIKAAEAIDEKITDNDYKSRRDFRDVPTFTIDPHDAKDFDDALSLRTLPNGNFEVGIHIADVTHYIDQKSIIDIEALNRGTSVYLVDRVVPMLPERLSNFICSLRPHEEKLCFSAVFEMNEEGHVLTEWFGRTVIYSDKRFTYEEAQEIIDGANGDMKEEILTLNSIARKLREDRFKKGSIAFERDEVKFEIDEKGKPLRVYFKQMKPANELIEEFMLLANKQVASLIGKVPKDKARTFVYRIHDKPDPEKLESFNLFVRKFGYNVNTASTKKISQSMNNILTTVKGKKEQDVVENLALRAMAKAAYSTKNIGHYGLGFKHYSHFTSPIRRYPDMMVHRLLAMYLDKQKSQDATIYEKWCRHASEMERKAIEAERSSIKYKQVEFMMDKIGNEYEGIISGVKDWGIYVEIIENKCEGMVPIRDIADDFYEFDEENFSLVGRRYGRVFQLGDPVKIRIVRANLAKKQLDFEFVDEEEGM